MALDILIIVNWPHTELTELMQATAPHQQIVDLLAVSDSCVSTSLLSFTGRAFNVLSFIRKKLMLKHKQSHMSFAGIRRE